MNYRPTAITAFGAFFFVVFSNLPGVPMGMGAAQADQSQSAAQASQPLEVAQGAATTKAPLGETTKPPLAATTKPPLAATTTPKPGNCSASSADGKDVCTTNCSAGQVASCQDGDPPSCACN